MGRVLLLAAGLTTVAASLPAQVAEDPRDPNGVGIPYPLVHLVHSDDPSLEGTTAHLRTHRPFLLYQLGRDLVNRQYTLRQGAYGRAGELSVPLYVAVEVANESPGEARFARDHANSCGMCHSMPAREPGAGQTIASTSSLGRNTPHFYGAGLVEMLAEQTRRKILNQYDLNRNGVLERAEVAAPCPVRIEPAPGAPAVAFGDLSPGADGVPRLNSVFRVWYLDEDGCPVPEALGMNDLNVVAFDFAMQAFGWGRGERRMADNRRVSEGGEAATIRGIFALAADLHLGLQAFDPVQISTTCPDRNEGGFAGISLNGAQQYDLGAVSDRGRVRSANSVNGLSLDDEDGDGKVSELTEGDLDAVEFYLLHAPAPAVRSSSRSEAGRPVLRRIGCVECHTETWQIEARDRRRGFPGDRRLLRLETRTVQGPGGESRLEGELVTTSVSGSDGGQEPAGGAFAVERIYTDFKHWDIGPEFHERRFDGSLQRLHRTAPLWGVGSTAPYGHAGQFRSLDEVIRAHGGAAQRQRQAYVRLDDRERRALLAYLESLVLFPTTWIAADIDGDGAASESFEVAGQKVGFERFDPRFLFRVSPRYEYLYWVVDPRGRKVPLYFLRNVEELYGLGLAYRRDDDGDGFPDRTGHPEPQADARHSSGHSNGDRHAPAE